ncbi:Cleavage and polyadenylation specificity factor subunit 3-II [Cardamine amara subsp. amara]|uniref:Cleavage and polyadenylation specificity factor subunit 3-II n=1 Tax=Cardamine amara subsp. amara TaxID=228776 RepID=A0ABD1A2L1_CARAN
MGIDCLVLGAGQEIGKSCVVVTINGKKIMFDCGMHMGCDDHNRYPDFSIISKSGDFDNAISCIIITHFHMDHVGALPYFTEVCGYNGPIYMSYPTKALSPLMLEDYRRVMVDRRGEEELFTTTHIANCMKKVIAIDLKQTIQVDQDLQIRAYYAGHVLGAVMVYAKVGDAAIVYTGDYNMTTDRHLGAAKIDRLQLDLLISESTYATTIRGSKYPREREFLQAVHKCVAGGGKALIPSFALGRAQELCMLLDDYWERMNIRVPIYFSSGLTIQANMYYKMLISWTSQNVKEKHSTHNPFDFKNVKDFDRSLIHAPGPCVLFATPGMLCAGFSLEVFKHWAPSPLNLVALPGYSVAGTVGHKLMSGKPTTVDLYNGTKVDVRCKIHQVAFSPHTDAKGIMDLTKFLSPKNVVLVHGEKPSMMSLKDKITSELDIPCFVPANGETVSFASTTYIKANASDMFLKSCSNPNFKFSNSTQLRVTDQRTEDGVLVIEKSKKAKIVHQDEVSEVLHEKNHEVSLAYCCPVKAKEETGDVDLIKHLSKKILETISGAQIHESENCLQVGSFKGSLCLKEKCLHRRINSEAVFLCCDWSVAELELGWEIINLIKQKL